MRRDLYAEFEPGRNSPCVCASGRKFKKCCYKTYREIGKGRPDWRAAFEAGKVEEALGLARAEFTRYVIWHRAHTVPVHAKRPDAVAHLFTIDILALGDLIDSLMWCYDEAGLHDQFPDVLQAVEGYVDDPRWSEQLLLRRTYWTLRPDWDEEVGRGLLSQLDPGRVMTSELLGVYLDLFTDSIGAQEKLTIADRILDLSMDPTEIFHYSLYKAVMWILLSDSNAAVRLAHEALQAFRESSSVDSSFSKLQEVRCLLLIGIYDEDAGSLEEALDRAREFVEEPGLSRKGKALGHATVGDALRRLGRHEEAIEHYLRSLDYEEDPPNRVELAQCFIAAGRADRASELLDSIDLDSANMDLRLDHAYAMYGLYSLIGGDELRERVVRLLRRAETRFPEQKGVRDDLLLSLTERPDGAGSTGWMRGLLQRAGKYLMLQPNVFGLGVNVNAIIDDAPTRRPRELPRPGADSEPNGDPD